MIIKKVVKHIVAKCFGKGIKELKNTDHYSTISFDIFDTLVCRTCDKPEKVFEIVENKYNEIHRGEEVHGFLNLRKSAEKQARYKNKWKEISLEQIYENIEPHIEKDVLNELKRIEIDTEIEVCIPNKEVVEVFNGISDKNVYLISDMYLPKKVIETILNKCNIMKYNELFVSSETGLMKRSGELYEYIFEGNKISKKEWLHIGDHSIADFIVPKILSINSFLYKRD